MNEKLINLSVVKKDRNQEKTAKEVLEECLKRNLTGVIVIGWEQVNDNPSDDEFYTHSSIDDGADSLWLLQTAKDRLLKKWRSNE